MTFDTFARPPFVYHAPALVLGQVASQTDSALASGLRPSARTATPEEARDARRTWVYFEGRWRPRTLSESGDANWPSTPAFRQAPPGYARCRVCGVLFTDLQFVSEPCSGVPVTVEAPRTAGTVACALCGVPVAVATEHRAAVEWFGTTCEACFGMVEALGSAA